MDLSSISARIIPMSFELQLRLYKDYAVAKEQHSALWDEHRRLEEEVFGDRISNMWKRGGEITQAQHEEYSRRCREASLAMGFDENRNHHESEEDIRFPSKRYPDHFFDVGFIRTSYEHNGFDQVLKILTRKDLAYIFDVVTHLGSPNSASTYFPNWLLVAARLAEVSQEFNRRVKEADGAFLTVVNWIHEPLRDATDVLQRYVNNRDLEKYDKLINEEDSKAAGVWYPEQPITSIDIAKQRVQGNQDVPIFPYGPLPLHGLTRGYIQYHSNDQPKEVLFLVTECLGVYDFYVQGIEIIQEMVDLVLAHPEPNKFAIDWNP
ncbi:MAG: hypothetical protein ABIY70_14165 [Capsulimonas sp.]|uniref:hypothetical protein n=1 Tax=Capsulimonas sp. TaxID=2494211 RepID=UPI003266B440